MRKILAIFALVLPAVFLAAPVAPRADSIVTVTPTFTCLFESCAMVGGFSGDDDDSATLAVQYRVTGSGTWIDAYTPMIDRRVFPQDLVGGTGYTNGTKATTSSGAGTGLTVGVTQSGGVVTSLTIVAAGSGYAVGDVITISTGDANATFVVSMTGNSTPTCCAVLDNSANDNQGRLKIFGLLPNTSYDFQATWTDTDGVSGDCAPTCSVTASTLTYAPTTGGSTYYIASASDTPAGSNSNDGSSGAPWLTLAHAISNSAAGDTIKCRTGSFAMGTISASGTAMAYRQLMPDTGRTCTWTVTGNNVAVLSADYWRMTASGTGGQMVFDTAPQSTIVISSGADHLYLEDFQMADVANGSIGTGTYSAFSLAGTNDSIYILRANLAGTSVVTTDSGPQIQAVKFGTLTNSVICDNIFTGQTATAAGWWDGIGNGLNSSLSNENNLDICRNQILHYRDDSVELDGGGINVGFWENETYTTLSTTGAIGLGLSMAPIHVGPTYVFRNWIHPSASLSTGLKYLSGDPAQTTIFLFHNTISTSVGGGSGRECMGGARYQTSLNNIFVCRGDVLFNAVGGGAIGNTFNYDAMYSTTSGNIVTNWNGTTTDYACVSTGCSPTFRSGASQELNGTGVNPTINTSTGTISNTSSAYNTGTPIANFNGPNSAWPGSIDMGFDIVDSGPTPGNNGTITTSSVTTTTLTISWTAASGISTLEYYGCRSTSAITTVAGCLAATQLFDYTAAKTSDNVTGLTAASTYYFNVIVRDGNGETTLYDDVSQLMACGASKVVFTSQPSSVATGVSLGTVRVAVQNPANTVCTDSTATITIANKGGTCTGMTLGGTTSGAAAAGIFTTTSLTENATGACTLNATSSGLTAGDSSAFTISTPVIAAGGGSRVRARTR